jgi:hypothetical protein
MIVLLYLRSLVAVATILGFQLTCRLAPTPLSDVCVISVTFQAFKTRK